MPVRESGGEHDVASRLLIAPSGYEFTPDGRTYVLKAPREVLFGGGSRLWGDAKRVLEKKGREAPLGRFDAAMVGMRHPLEDRAVTVEDVRRFRKSVGDTMGITVRIAQPGSVRIVRGEYDDSHAIEEAVRASGVREVTIEECGTGAFDMGREVTAGCVDKRRKRTHADLTKPSAFSALDPAIRDKMLGSALAPLVHMSLFDVMALRMQGKRLSELRNHLGGCGGWEAQRRAGVADTNSCVDLAIGAMLRTRDEIARMAPEVGGETRAILYNFTGIDFDLDSERDVAELLRLYPQGTQTMLGMQRSMPGYAGAGASF